MKPILHRLVAIHQDDHGWLCFTDHFTVEGDSADPMLGKELLATIQLAVDDRMEFLDLLPFDPAKSYRPHGKLNLVEPLGQKSNRYGQIFWALLCEPDP